MTTVTPQRRQTQEQRAQAIHPLFALIDEQGRQRVWVAQRVGISRQRLHAYEQGLNRPPEWVIERMCALLGFPRALLPSTMFQPASRHGTGRPRKHPAAGEVRQARGPPAA